VTAEIHIKDLSSPKYRLFITAGLLLFSVSAIAWYLDLSPLIYYGAAALAIGCFFVISFDTFTSSNSISVDRYGATLKLLGEKTYGFRFEDIQSIDLSERGLYIELKEMEAVKLSRKRYKQKSLENIYTLLTTKNNKL
jgi:hypothetical protein